MYDEIILAPRQGDDKWTEDHLALESAWADAGVHPEPVIRLSVGADVVGHFLFSAGMLAGTFGALKEWLKGRAGRIVWIKLEDGTELKANTVKDLDRLAETIIKLRKE